MTSRVGRKAAKPLVLQPAFGGRVRKIKVESYTGNQTVYKMGRGLPGHGYYQKSDSFAWRTFLVKQYQCCIFFHIVLVYIVQAT
jgi:hypothetical protein